MAQRYSIGDKKLQKLVVLWALGEAGLGGLIHATGLPITGLLVGGWAMICLSLMAKQGARTSDYFAALAQVLIIKAIASPHSPPTAYLAVSFQGLIAALFFGKMPWKLAVGATAILTMVESAAQKLITVTLIFGGSLWKGVDALAAKVASSLGFEVVTGASWKIAAAWLGVHALFGAVLTVWIWRLPQQLESLPPIELQTQPQENLAQKKTPSWYWLLLCIPVALLFLLPEKQALFGLLRLGAVLLLWFTAGRWFIQKLRNRFQKRAESHRHEVQEVLDALPHYRQLARAAWSQSSTIASGPRRWSTAALLLLRHSLS
ncbi:MAG: hypothetical protein AB8F95_19735 [Bacteroidia bacterium]